MITTILEINVNNLNVSIHRGLPKRLIEENLVSADNMTRAINRAKAEQISLLDYICTQGMIDDDIIAEVAAREFGMSVYNLDDANIEEISALPKKILDRKLLRKHVLLPLFIRDKRLFVATADPSHTKGLRELQFQVRMSVEPVLVAYSKLMNLREKLLDDVSDNLAESLNINSEDYDVVNESTSFNIDPEAEDKTKTGSTPIVRFVNKMIFNAITMKASDIHFEPYDHHYRVRFRVDGILREIFKPPPSWSSRLVSRVKIMANLDITERRIPQDGRIRVTVADNKSIDLRVNTLPMQFGEKVVMRILDPATTTIGIDKLGYEDDQRAAFLSALGKSQGMILVTGPTGSGKTVSLYTGLNILNTDERNISTAEDPVEINIAGINQTQINLRVGFDFPTTLRAFLRQDPDVIMVGEIRDLETAEIAVKASQTGHLVLSTLHTNSSTETINRLLNMGLSSFNVATSVSLIIAQRLARKLCEFCRKPQDNLPAQVLSEEGLDKIDIDVSSFTIYEPVGCDKCEQGYSGRVGIYETLVISPAISEVILNGGSSVDIFKAAQKEGFRPMRVSALRKVAEGIISIKEANRVATD